ncbi:MAG: hypothetical protein QM426_11160 [Euryarchaeota archaeon]|nr:hypothetical protein [Euryarchaeota archaeon]
MYSCLTCDVEVGSVQNIEELKKIILLLNQYEISCTFFVEISEKNSDLYLEVSDIFENHEVGLHIHWGNMESYKKGLNKIAVGEMQTELQDSLQCLKEVGFRPICFRGGGLCCTNESLDLLKKYKFKIDSSVAANLDEKTGWYQGHKNVPYLSYYYPSKSSYDIPATSPKKNMGILEIPVTRMIPSGNAWFPYTLTPDSPIFKLILNEWILKSKLETLTTVTPIFHSWGEGRLRNEKFPQFIDKLEKMIKYMIVKRFEFITLKDFSEIVEGNKL